MKIIKQLTSLRFFAVVAIFIRHLDFFYFKYNGGVDFYNRYFAKGWIGVSYFFILSGFLLTYRYKDKLQKSVKFNLKKFYISRLARFYPLHIITLFLALPLPPDYPVNEFAVQRFFANLFLLQSFVPRLDFYASYNGVSWYLSDLLLFTLLFPFLIFLFLKLKIFSQFKSFLLMVFIWVFAFVMMMINAWDKNPFWLFYVSPYFRLVEFVCGMLLGLAFLYNTHASKIKKSIYIYIRFLRL